MRAGGASRVGTALSITDPMRLLAFGVTGSLVAYAAALWALLRHKPASIA
jgi:hypothetical protein